MASSDLVAKWEVSVPKGKYGIEFEHGTTSGKRVIRVNGKEIYRQDWMFKLVGKEHFAVGGVNCVISIDAVDGFAYEYSLEVNGKTLAKFRENQAKVQKSWRFYSGTGDSTEYRIVLTKDSLGVWVNGSEVETAGEFVDDGVETHFTFGVSHNAVIKAVSSGKRRSGLVHTLYVDDIEIPEVKE